MTLSTPNTHDTQEEVSKDIPCPKCGGSGSFDEPNSYFNPDDDDCIEDEFISVACPNCHGEGTSTAAACPYCASTDVFVERADYSSAYVQCNDCGCRGPIGSTEGDDEEDTPGGVAALAAWNRRTAKPANGARTLDEWHEDHGDVVWWCWRNGAWLGEAAYIGTPLDLGQTVEVELRTNQREFVHRHDVGGWPGYHTHWTPHPALPSAPKDTSHE